MPLIWICALICLPSSAAAPVLAIFRPGSAAGPPAVGIQ
jgi:hypothetical protein